MDLALEKQKLIDELNSIDDIHLIKAIKEMLSYAHSIKEKRNASSELELISRIQTSEEDIANGRTITLAKVREKYKR